MQIPSFRAALLFFLFLLTSILSLSAQRLNEAWDDRFELPGLAGKVSAMLIDAQNHLYLRGDIRGPNNLSDLHTIIQWDGTMWRSLGIPAADTMHIEGKPVRIAGKGLMASIGTMLYTVADDLDTTAPNFPPLRRIVAWNGTAWNLVGESFHGEIHALATYGSVLYAAGAFEQIGTKAIRRLAQWNGMTWNNVGEGVNDNIGAMAVDRDGVLYVTGSFDSVGTVRAEGSARWNGSEWEALSGPGYDTRRLIPATSGTAVYGLIGDTFYRLQGKEWTPIDTGIYSAYVLFPYILATDGIGNIYVGGKRSSGTEAPSVIVRTNGTTWSELPGEFDNEITGLVTAHGEPVFAAGYFANVNRDILVNRLAHWNGQSWEPLAHQGTKLEGLSGATEALAIYNGYLYAGGAGLQTPSLSGKHAILRRPIVAGTTAAWETVGGGVEGSILAAINNPTGGIYVGGCFNRAGNSAAANVALWDGTAWRPLGGGPGFCVIDLSFANGNLYALGSGSLARWDGREWTRLTDDIRGRAYAVAAADDGTVYVGGEFDSVGNLRVNNVAEWHNGEWKSLADGVRLGTSSHTFPGADHSFVRSLAVDGNRLYAGGLFDTAGTTEAFNIAWWDGITWSAMDKGLTGYTYTTFAQIPPEVWKIVVAGNRIFAGGHFQNAGTWWTGFGAYSTGSGITYWDKETEQWEWLGSGVATYKSVKPVVRAIAATGSSVWIGGSFIEAGSQNSYGIAGTAIFPPYVSLSPVTESLDFGGAPVGRRVGRSLTITNPATSTRTLAGRIEIIEGPFTPAIDPNFRIAPNDSTPFAFRFLPLVEGYAEGRAVIYHDADDNAAPLYVKLTGFGIPLQLEATAQPSAIDFGTYLQRDEVNDTSVVIRNPSTSNSYLSIRADTLRPPFSFISKYDTEETQLKPGEARRFYIQANTDMAGDFTQTLTIRHDAAPGGTIEIPLHISVTPRFSKLTITPLHIDFGGVPINRTVKIPVVLANDPRANVYAGYQALPLHAPFYINTNSDGSPPGAADTLFCFFTPLTEGDFFDTLHIRRSETGKKDTLHIPVRGRGRAFNAQIQLSAASIDFGSVERGKSRESILMISNPPSADDTLFVTPSVIGSRFSIDPASKEALLPGQSLPLHITFAPAAGGIFQGTLTLTHNAVGTESPAKISLRGESITSGVPDAGPIDSPLLSAEPNPAVGKTQIHFRADHPAHALLSILALDGRRVAQLLDAPVEAAEQSVEWDTEDQPPGVYLVTLTMGEKTTTMRILVR